MTIPNVFFNRDGSIDPITYVASGRCKFCKKMITGGINLMNYHIWKEHNDLHILNVKTSYTKMSSNYKSKYTLKQSLEIAERYFKQIDNEQKKLK